MQSGPIIPIPKQDWSTSPHSTIRKILMSTSSARRSRCASEMMLIYLTKVVFLQDDCVCVVNLRPHFLFIPHHPITSYDSYLRYRPHIVCILNYNLYYCFNDSSISNSIAGKICYEVRSWKAASLSHPHTGQVGAATSSMIYALVHQLINKNL